MASDHGYEFSHGTVLADFLLRSFCSSGIPPRIPETVEIERALGCMKTRAQAVCRLLLVFSPGFFQQDVQLIQGFLYAAQAPASAGQFIFQLTDLL